MVRKERETHLGYESEGNRYAFGDDGMDCRRWTLAPPNSFFRKEDWIDWGEWVHGSKEALRSLR